MISPTEFYKGLRISRCYEYLSLYFDDLRYKYGAYIVRT